MSHSETPPTQPLVGQPSQPVINTTTGTASVKRRVRLRTPHDLDKSKSRKIINGSDALPYKKKPYSKTIRMDEDARRAGLREGDSSSGDDTERPPATKKRAGGSSGSTPSPQTQAPRKPRGSAAANDATSTTASSTTAHPTTSTSASPNPPATIVANESTSLPAPSSLAPQVPGVNMIMHQLTVPNVPAYTSPGLPPMFPVTNGQAMVNANAYGGMYPSPHAGVFGMAQPQSMFPQASSSVPLHLVRHSQPPSGMVPSLQMMYLKEHGQDLTDEGLVMLWTAMNEGSRHYAVECYVRTMTDTQMGMADAGFVRTQLSRTSSIASSTSQAGATQQDSPNAAYGAIMAQHGVRQHGAPTPEPSIARSQHAVSTVAGPSAPQHVALTTVGPVQYSQHTAEHQPVSPVAISHSSSASSEQSLNMVTLETNAMNEPAAMDTEPSYSDASDDSSQEFLFDEDNGTIVPDDKGKGRAYEDMNYDIDADDEADDGNTGGMEDDDDMFEGPTPGVDEFTSRTDGVHSDLVLMMMHKMDGMRRTIRDQAGCLQEMLVSGRAFQQAMLEELRGIRSSLGQPSGAPAPATKPPLRTSAANRVHTHVRSLLKISTTSEVATQFPEWTDEDIAAYNAAHQAVDAAEEDIRPDFLRPWKGAHAFFANRRARKVMIKTFQRKAEGGMFAVNPPPAKFLTDEYLGKVIDQYVTTLRRAYREAINPPSREAKDALKAKRAETSRKDSTFKQRLYVVVHQGYPQHCRLMHMLASENMSADESDSPDPVVPKIWRIIFAAWQSAELRNFLWALDAKYIKTRARPEEEGKRRTPGNADSGRCSSFGSLAELLR
ncbi:hypothetical protein C8Q80DRAFT_1122900 [Daedaleopsis nitida]|nr:hypothetical protein C8Q80DRAFT_1122900 [Daedaleopsis nitida]